MSTIDTELRDAQTIYDEIDKLIEQNRVNCLWFVRTDYFPKTTEERLSILRDIERHGNRATFVAARNLRDCLLQISNETSAG